MSTMTTPRGEQRSQAVDLIASWAAEDRHVGLMPRKLVIDRLLDLRNLMSGPDLIGVDAILVEVPGLTVVESSWWHDQVDWLESFAATQLQVQQG